LSTFREVSILTKQYLAGELSVRLEKLLEVTAPSGAVQVAELRHEVESGSLHQLPAELRRAIALADGLCWESLTRGDAAAFARQAAVSADLRQFGACARLIGDD